MNLGNAIKLIRTQSNLTQTELAEQAGISVSYLSMLERNKRDPNFSTLERIIDVLNVPMSIFVFLAADEDEISSIDRELAERLSVTALQLIKTSANECSTL